MLDEPLVHVIDDDEAVRQSLEFLLNTAEFAVCSYDSATAFLDVLPEIRCGCIISDVRMPDLTGIQLLEHIQKMEVGLPAILITGHGDVPLALEAMQMGAVDFLEKPFEDEVLLASVRAALNGLETASAHETQKREFAERIDALSCREREVLEGLIAGHPNKTIAFDLHISPRTVEIYGANLMTKMQAASLSDLIRMALIAGILTDHR